jgi:hypothetical protein
MQGKESDMPRIGATLAAFALIACSIGVNISRYPVVWEMAAPTAQSASSPQQAKRDSPLSAEESVSETLSVALAAELPAEVPIHTGTDRGGADPVRPGCPSSEAYSYLPPAADDSAMGDWGEQPGVDPVESTKDVAALPLSTEEPVDAQASSWDAETPAGARDREVAPFEVYAGQPGGAYEAESDETTGAATGDSVPDSDPPADDEPHRTAPFAEGPWEPDRNADSAEVESLFERPEPALAGGQTCGQYEDAAEVEPQGAYAEAASGPLGTQAECSGGVGDLVEIPRPSAMSLSATNPQREVVAVTPTNQDDSATHEDTELTATTAAPFGFRAELRRLPPVEEINPFLNDGHDPPIPDISGRNYPDTGSR